MPTLLLTTIFLPLAGACWIWTAKDRGKVAFRQSAAVTVAFTFVMSVILIANYQPGDEPYAVWSIPWLGAHSPLDVQLSVGLDGLSLWLFGLTSLLMITAVLVGWEAIEDRPGLYYGLLLTLQTGMLGVFAARDIILFYVFFEFTLIPLFFLIGIWGSEDRRYAAIKFFLFTLAGSLITFLGLLAIVLWVFDHSDRMTFSIAELTRHLADDPILFQWQLVIFLALFAGFAIKVPLFPLHTWLPLAHTQAPVAGSVLLAGVLLKLGIYGFARFSVPMLPQATAACAPWILWLSAIGIIYGALVALVQTDMKRLIAYSSVSHLGFCMLGLFALNTLSVQGSVLQMVNHGLSTGGLFAVIGMVYERYHTREISKLGGLAAADAAVGRVHAAVHLLEHRSAWAERFRRRISDPARHVLPGLERSSFGAFGASEGDRRDLRAGRRAGGLVHALAGRAGVLWPVARARSRARSGKCRPRSRRAGGGARIRGPRRFRSCGHRARTCRPAKCWPWPRSRSSCSGSDCTPPFSCAGWRRRSTRSP